jgi:hypothetical protein
MERKRSRNSTSLYFFANCPQLFTFIPRCPSCCRVLEVSTCHLDFVGPTNHSTLKTPAAPKTVEILLLFRSRLCHYSVGGAWWHLDFCESF